MKRTDILNALIKKYDYQSYLEIGVKTPSMNFDLIDISEKDGVDPKWMGKPDRGGKYEMTSDAFFESIDENRKYDLVFIDGLHHHKQISRDFKHALLHLNENGTIVFHDANPTTEAMQTVPRAAMQWTGDGWKSIFRLRCTREDLNIFVVNTDFGCGIVRRGSQDLYECNMKKCMTWKFFNKHRVKMLNLISVEDFKKWLN